MKKVVLVFMRPKNEEKRSKIWKLVMIVSSSIIVLGVTFFIVLGVMSNPLEGEWFSEEHDYFLEVEDENEATLHGTFRDAYLEIELHYTMNKKDKTISIRPDGNAYEEAIEDSKGKITASELDELLEEFMNTYNYSLDRDTLTLSEREYGEQYIFTRIDK